MRATVIVLGYVLLAFIFAALYYGAPAHREDVKFWIPQLLLLVLITVTTLYVFYTATLVEETRRLQQRPLVSVSFRELSQPPGFKIDKIYDHAEGLMRGVAQAFGGTESKIPSTCMALEVRNIGQTTLRDFSLEVAFTGPDRQQVEASFSVAHDIERDGIMHVAVAPAALPWIRLRVTNVVYGDGFRKYTEFSGDPWYEKKTERPRVMQPVASG